jgi:hypothetical protein
MASLKISTADHEQVLKEFGRSASYLIIILRNIAQPCSFFIEILFHLFCPVSHGINSGFQLFFSDIEPLCPIPYFVILAQADPVTVGAAYLIFVIHNDVFICYYLLYQDS